MRVFCEAEGARCVARARYRGAARFALVGGINTFAALSLQTALQASQSATALVGGRRRGAYGFSADAGRCTMHIAGQPVEVESEVSSVNLP